MTLVGVLQQVSKHWSDIVPLSDFLKDKYLIEEAAQSRHYHLEFDRYSDLTLESSIREIFLIWILVVINNADQ